MFVLWLCVCIVGLCLSPKHVLECNGFAHLGHALHRVSVVWVSVVWESVVWGCLFQFLYLASTLCVSGITSRSQHCHKVEVNLATLSFLGYYQI